VVFQTEFHQWRLVMTQSCHNVHKNLACLQQPKIPNLFYLTSVPATYFSITVTVTTFELEHGGCHCPVVFRRNGSLLLGTKVTIWGFYVDWQTTRFILFIKAHQLSVWPAKNIWGLNQIQLSGYWNCRIKPLYLVMTPT